MHHTFRLAVVVISALLLVAVIVGSLMYLGQIPVPGWLRPAPPALPAQNWTIQVVTEVGEPLPPDARVWFEVHGTRGGGASPLCKLDHPGRFESNQTDQFTFPSAGIGELVKVKVWQGREDRKYGWVIKDVKLTDNTTGQTYRFAGGALTPQSGGRRACLVMIPMKP